MKLRMKEVGCVLVLAATLVVYGETARDGVWSGKTSQDKVISFEIKDGVLKSFTLGWTVPLEEPCATTPGSSIALTALGGTDTLHFPYSMKEYDLLKGQGETRIDPATVAPALGEKGFEVSRDLGGKARLSVTAQTQADGSIVGTATITATTCKGSQKLSWSTSKGKQLP
ncbi:MAG: hypothetical protein LAO31_01360 [Acidobacteriia bacterium]|nr:hypothetical protein [Terriglobia bacterium]